MDDVRPHKREPDFIFLFFFADTSVRRNSGVVPERYQPCSRPLIGQRVTSLDDSWWVWRPSPTPATFKYCVQRLLINMEGTTRENTPWTVAEVESLLSVVAEDRIQSKPSLCVAWISTSLMTTHPLWRDTNSRWKRNTSETKPRRATLRCGETSWYYQWKDGITWSKLAGLWQRVDTYTKLHASVQENYLCWCAK